MKDYGNLAALLGESDNSKDDESSIKDDTDGMDGQDSSDQVFASAAQEAFHAIKENDAEGFAEALKVALGAC